jgi:hypothetical protein
MIQTECKGCGQKIKVADDMAGRRTRCPSCGDPVKIPLGNAPASSPEPPRAKTPPPTRRPSSAIPMGKPVAPPPMPAANPFDFNTPAVLPAREQPKAPQTQPPAVDSQPATVAAAVPEANAGSLQVGGPSFSLPRTLASYAALAGAIAGACIMIQIGPSEDAVTELLGRVARGDMTVERLKGALIGLIAGLLIGCAVSGLVGRTRTTALGAVLLAAAGGVYGGIRTGAEGELSWFLIVSGSFLGAALAAVVGALVGTLLDLLRGRA